MTIRSTARRPDSVIGNKAANLQTLIEMGLPVPALIAIPAGGVLADPCKLLTWLEEQTPSGEGGWRLAIRSSSAQEDGAIESKAGHFLSLLGTFDGDGLLDAIERVSQSGPDMGVIVQLLVEARHAGAFFSCDPVSFERNVATIAWTEGLADELLDGTVTGEHVRLDSCGQISDGVWPGTQYHLDTLAATARDLEKSFGAPADIEWVIDHTGQLWFIQARPVVLPPPTQLALDHLANFDLLPPIVRQHHKIRLRRQAALLGVPMAPATAVTRVRGRPEGYGLSPAFDGAAAASIVLLHPEHINCAIVREFAPLQGNPVEKWTEKCRRYAIRRYPSVDGIEAALGSVLQAGLGQSWTATAVIQAVWDAAATGIIRKTDEHYLIDVAQGHFVPKGIVTTSTILLARDRARVNAIWRDQPTAYHFVDGHVVSESPPRSQLRLPDALLGQIAETLDPLFDVYREAALEFGILDHGDKFEVYLIDIAEGDASSITLDGDMISSGVLSTGLARGHVRRIDNKKSGAFDSHLYDQPARARTDQAESVIIVADRASTDLLGHICSPGVAGFIFRNASTLAHLSVVLREKGVPAVTLEDDAAFARLTEGLLVELDASTRLSDARNRVRLLESTKQ